MNTRLRDALLGLGVSVGLLLGATGCTTDGYCFADCDGSGKGGNGGGTVVQPDSGGTQFNQGDGSCLGLGCNPQEHDSGSTHPNCEKTNGGREACDNIDNDCDGLVDEPGVPPDGIDYTDPTTCGNCTNNCLEQVSPVTVDKVTCTPPASNVGKDPGTCGYDTCSPNYYDIDHDRTNGCEYACPFNPDGKNAVDLPGPFGCDIDDDCNGKKDDNLDYCDDPQNCGGCGITCTLPNTDTVTCVSTKTGAECEGNAHCAIGKCHDGYVDANGSPDDGCEYPCVPTNGGIEICDGVDNDCDRLVDNADDSLTDAALGVTCQGGDKGVCADPANAGVMKCIDGVATCCDVDSNNVKASNGRYPDFGVRNNQCVGAVGPFVVSVNELQERCNGLDDNCDGDVDNSTVDSGAVCGTSVGTCKLGHTACIAGALACPDAIPPDPAGERCDGQDNDCDGVIDYTTAKTGATPPQTRVIACSVDADCASSAPFVSCIQIDNKGTKSCVRPAGDIADGTTGAPLACDVTPAAPSGATQPCRPGKMACFGGVPVCQGSIKKPSDLDRCGEDTNCDGVLENQTGLANDDPKNCGACGNDCLAAAGGHGVWACQAGTCVRSGCQTGFIECGGASANDCETSCTFDQSVELCDGIDNNCNCQIDEGSITPPSVIQACGVASGATDPGCNAKVSLSCVSGAWKCTFTDPAYCTTGKCSTTPDICDGKDNNCDGVIDEGFRPPALLTGFLGQACFSDDGKPLPGDGPCRTQGTFVCNAGGSATVCSAKKDTTKATAEVCDGVDNNCDGTVDNNLSDPRIGQQCFGGTKGVCAQPAHAGTQQCVNGAIGCTGANLVKPGDILETCNGQDDDCSGTVDDNLTDTGGVCGSSVGECKAGARTCTAGVLTCSDTGPKAEICDGLDNNCNGQIDDSPTDVGTACDVPPPPPTGVPQPCKAGVYSCVGGSKICQGSIKATATADACGEDTNCDGKLTGQTGLSNNDVLNCGSCGHDCNALDPNSTWACNAGTCVHTGCKTGHIDCDGNANTCERACIVSSATEICDGVDNNCDCQIDNNVPAATPVQVCGVSPSATEAGCTSGVTTTCTAGTWKCTFPAGYCTTGNCNTTTELCDGKDNNCNGVQDELFKAPILTTGFLGQSCTTPASDGPCQGSGTYVCNGAGTGTTCTAVKDNSKSKPETCNNVDDNCDGQVDNSPSGVGTQCFGGTQGECAAVAHAGTTACQSGSIVCTGANLLKPNQQSETCNGKDDDCDGNPDNNPTDVGGPCGSGVGACIPGTYVCQNGAKVCQGAVTGTPEICDGIDNNCDNQVDNSPSGLGGDCNVPKAPPPPTAQCPVVTSPCKKGTLACTSGVTTCNGSVTASPSTPDTCCVDANCDGTLTNQPDFLTDVQNCGGCGNDCNALNAGKHGVWACVAGACQRTACQNGYINCDGVNGDCERACSLSGAEQCNGVDDDCNCQVDDNIASIPTPSQVCGVSATASDPLCAAGNGTNGVLVACNSGAWKCTFPTGYCNGGSPAACSSTSDLCDGKDNNCNGATDEPYKLPVKATGYIGQPCASDDGKPPPGDGACQGTGSWQCNSTTTTACNATKNLANISAELCDGVDNDCDGSVDEPFSKKGTNTTYFVKPAAVKISASLWTFQYEASRPNAGTNSPGTGDGYWCSGASCTGGVASTVPAGVTLDKTPACSVQGKIPWFNVTPVEVEQTCQAMGGFVCSTANFTTICQSSSATCKWGYGTGCGTAANYPPPAGNTPFCNLHGYDFDRSFTAPITDGLLPTGSSFLSSCYALWNGSASASAYDITGNLREITKRAANDYPLMGGAYDTASDDGAMCDFTFYSVPTTFKFSDTGFRCCFSADPTL
ncbi:MAG TPA: MopE-related protein [Polyangiaceae bacterium]|nr:MopE-related protein [Polyangiaceae bacterium]